MAGTACVATASTASCSDSLALLVVLAVAQHAEVPGHPAVGVDRDAGQDLLALLEPEPLHVEVRQADPVRGVRRVLAVVRRHRLREALEVLGDLARGLGHRFSGGYIADSAHESFHA